MISSRVLDKYIAPGISTFTRADIPDLAGKFPQADHWVSNFFLRNLVSELSASKAYTDQARQLVLGYLRRARLAVDAYAEARDMTLRYLDGNNPDNPRIRAYYAAVARWENFVIESSIALDTCRWLGNQKLFNKGDQSLRDRLYHLANKVKHLGDDIRNKNLYSVTDSVPLWLSDEGLNGMGAQVTYAEAAQFLEDVTEFADELQDPQGLYDKAQAQAAAQSPATTTPGAPSSS